MGSSSSSTVNQKYDTTVVNKSDIDILNKNVNNFVADTVVNQASKCSASIDQLQSIDLSDMKVAGDLNFAGSEQSQQSAITFNCVQVSAFQNDIANGILNKYVNAMENSYSTDALDKLEAAAGTSAKGGFLSTGAVNTDSTVNVDYKFTNITDTHKNLQNVVENSIKNNMSLSDISDCIATVKTNQKFSLAGTTVGGNANIGAITQNQASTLMTKCIQEKNNANKITEQIVTNTGVKVDEENSVKKSTSISSAAKAESKNSGIFESLGDGLKSAFEGVGSMFGGIFSAMLAGPMMSVGACFLVCCCLISIIFAAYKLMGGGGDSATSEPSSDQMEGGALIESFAHIGKIAKSFKTN